MRSKFTSVPPVREFDSTVHMTQSPLDKGSKREDKLTLSLANAFLIGSWILSQNCDFSQIFSIYHFILPRGIEVYSEFDCYLG